MIKNKLYIAADGDSIGQKIGQAVLMDDVQGLHETSQRIVNSLKVLENWVRQKGGQVISSGGDELTAFIDGDVDLNEIEDIRNQIADMAGFTLTVGTGLSLSQAGKALIAGKLTGKNQLVSYDDSVEDVLHEAHQASQSGEADEEQQKMDDHYLSAMGEEQRDMDADDMVSDIEDDNKYQQDGMLDQDEMPEEEMSEQDEFSDQDEESPEMDSENSLDFEEVQPTEDDLEEEEEPDYSNAVIHGEEDESEELSDVPMEGDSQESESFEEEEPITLEGALNEDQPKEANKADETEMQDETQEPEQSQEFEDEMMDAQGSEDIMQRIAQNLAMFKENKALIEEARESNPEFYEAVMGLLQNLIDLAKQVSGAQDESLVPTDGNDTEMVEEQSPEEFLPKQKG